MLVKVQLVIYMILPEIECIEKTRILKNKRTDISFSFTVISSLLVKFL